MLALALTLCLGQLGAAPRAAHLLDEVAAQVPLDAPLVQAEPVRVSAAQLQVDIAALKRMRPSVGGGIGLMVAGLSVAAAGGLYLGLGASLSGLGGSGLEIFAYLGGGLMAIGLPLAMAGIWLLVTRGAERELIDDEMERMKKQLAAQQRLEQQFRAPVGPPPPFPSGALQRVPTVEVARF